MATNPELLFDRWTYETPEAGSGLEPDSVVTLYDTAGGFLEMIEAVIQPSAGKVYLLVFNLDAAPIANSVARHSYGPIDATTDGGTLVREYQEIAGYALRAGVFYGLPFGKKIYAGLSSTPRIFTPVQGADHWSLFARGTLIQTV